MRLQVIHQVPFDESFRAYFAGESPICLRGMYGLGMSSLKKKEAGKKDCPNSPGDGLHGIYFKCIELKGVKYTASEGCFPARK